MFLFSSKQRNVTLQRAARQLRVFYTHNNAGQTSDGMCTPIAELEPSATNKEIQEVVCRQRV